MQCPHCHAELAGNPVTCPECRQKLRSLSQFNANRPAGPSTPRATPQQQRVAPPVAARPSQPPRAVPGGIAPNSNFQEPSNGKVGIILGYIGLGGWLIPILGIPLSIVGLVFAKKENHRTAKILNTCVLVASIINAVIGAILASS